MVKFINYIKTHARNEVILQLTNILIASAISKSIRGFYEATLM